MIWMILAIVCALAAIALTFVYERIEKTPVEPEKFMEMVDRKEHCLAGILCTMSLWAVFAIVGVITIFGGCGHG